MAQFGYNDYLKKSPLSDKTFLIIDDSAMMRDILQAALNAFGVGDVITTNDGDTAIENIILRPVDAIIVDWKMDPYDGIDIVRHVRRNLPDPKRRIPILMCSGYNEMSRIIQARDAGVTDFLCKPVKPRNLYDKLCAALNDDREFIISESYVGPQRRGADEYRMSSKPEASGVVDLDSL